MYIKWIVFYSFPSPKWYFFPSVDTTLSPTWSSSLNKKCILKNYVTFKELKLWTSHFSRQALKTEWSLADQRLAKVTDVAWETAQSRGEKLICEKVTFSPQWVFLMALAKQNGNICILCNWFTCSRVCFSSHPKHNCVFSKNPHSEKKDQEMLYVFGISLLLAIKYRSPQCSFGIVFLNSYCTTCWTSR